MKPLFFFAAGCAVLPNALFGFGAEDASRPVPPAAQQATTERPSREPSEGVVAGKDQILLPALKGLVLAKTAEQALSLQQALESGVKLAGFTPDQEASLQEIAEKALGQPVSLRSLDELSSKLETALRADGRAFVKVSFPPQEITSGVIAVLACPARAGAVLIKGKPSFGLRFSADAFRTLPGNPIDGDVVMEDLDWINENPLRRASISYADGAAADAIDLSLRLRSEKPWRGYAGIDNQLSESLGDERVFLGFQHGNVFGMDHRLTTQATASLDAKSLLGISSIYEIPLPGRHLLDVSLGYTESEADAAGPIDQSGKFSRIALMYRIPLPRWHSISHQWRAGMEYRDNDYLFSDGSRDRVRFFQLETGWKGKRNDAYGYTRVDGSISYSPGHGLLGSEDDDFIALGADGAQSWIARLELERSLKLGKMANLLGRCQAQWADSALLSSDQIAAAGVGRVRGFDEIVGYASRGMLTSIELQSRIHHTAKAGNWQGIAFVDAAFLQQESSNDVGELASAGIGLRWRYQDSINARIDLGIPFVFPEDVDSTPLLHFSVSTTW